MATLSHQTDHHSHQFNGLTSPVVSPRSEEALAELQRRRDQAFVAKNKAEAAVIFARRDLYLATQRYDVAETLRFTRAHQVALTLLAERTAAYDVVVEEIQELIAAELAEVAA